MKIADADMPEGAHLGEARNHWLIGWIIPLTSHHMDGLCTDQRLLRSW
ncbi:hypothetical protein [Sphingorhabdus sp. 109]|nr:hypothetical protein [Sphingorhabdus sp. 109]